MLTGCMSHDVISAFDWLIYVNSNYGKNGKFWMLKINVKLGLTCGELASCKHILKKTEQNFQEHICNLQYFSWNVISYVLYFLYNFEN